MKAGLWGLLRVLLPVPVTLDTLVLPPSPASFPDTTRHRHRAKPGELFEMLPCTLLQIAPSWVALSPLAALPAGLGWRGWLPCCYQGFHTPARQPCETMPLFTL